MSRYAIRVLLGLLMYAGVALFCVPSILGKVDGLAGFQLAGAAGAVIFGMLRCYWSEEDCWHHRVRP